MKAWTPYNIHQWELTKKEAVLLLNNPPTNTDASTYTTGCCKQITDKEARIPALKKSIESWTTGKELHAGRLQGDCNSKTLDFPEPLLCILFVLRYAITNKQSLNDLKRLLPTDYIPSFPQYAPQEFYDPTWLRSHLVNNIVEIVDLFMGGLNSPVQKATLPYPENTSTRMRMALLHTTTKAFIQVLLKYGSNPKLPTENETYKDFIQYLKDRKTSGKPTTATEVIFDALPQLVKTSVEKYLKASIKGVPSKTDCKSVKWNDKRIPPVTIDSFNIIIVAAVTGETTVAYEPLPILGFVNKVFDATIMFSEIPTPPIITKETTSPTKKRKATSTGGGGGGGGGTGGGTPKKKTQPEPQLYTTTIEKNLQSIEEATRTLANQDNNDLIATITTAVSVIRNNLAQYNASKNAVTSVATDPPLRNTATAPPVEET